MKVKNLQNRYVNAAIILEHNDFKNGVSIKELAATHNVKARLFYNLLALRAKSIDIYDRVANGEQSYNWAYKEAVANERALIKEA